MGKHEIIKTINQNKPASKPYPDGFEESTGLKGQDLLDVFKESLKQSGASVNELEENEAADFISVNFKSALDFTNTGIWEKYGENCHKSELDKIDNVIINGLLGVSENGAIWVDDSCMPNRLIPFITKKLIIRLSKNELVPNMHEAYNRIVQKDYGFGVFISGPSKTADIEQSLVYGAHGAKEVVVNIV